MKSVGCSAADGRLAVFNIPFPLCLSAGHSGLGGLMPLLGFTVRQARRRAAAKPALRFHLYLKTLFYSFKAEDSSSAQRYPNT